MPSFSVGALAISSRRANAVGAVRLTCRDDALEVELVRAGPFSRGFAPGALAEEVAFRAPYTAVRGLVRERRTLHLALDPAVVAPYNRFALARFSTDPAAVLAGAHAARVRARLAAWALPLPVGLVAALAAPGPLVSGALGRASLGALVALAGFAVLRELVAWRTWGGPESDGYRDAFEVELSRRLGLAPARVEIDVPLDLAALDAPDRPAARPIPRAAFGAVLVAVFATAALALFHRVVEAPPPKAAAAALTSEPEPAVETPPAPPAPPPLPRCVCLRADSPLWQAGMPTVAVLLFNSAEDGAAPIKPTIDGRGRGRYDFEVAAVNDSDKPVRDVSITLTFARRNKRGKRVGATDRGLFWEGVLAPGKAVKWHVKAPGTEMKVEASVHGTLEQAGLDPAPPDAAFELTQSRYRAVRLQGAKLLAYARDPRAADVVQALAAGASPAEAEVLAQLARAAAPVFACSAALDADASEDAGASAASACVFNGSTAPVSGASLRDSARSADVPIPNEIAPHEGVRFAWPCSGAPGEVEIRRAGN